MLQNNMRYTTAKECLMYICKCVHEMMERQLSQKLLNLGFFMENCICQSNKEVNRRTFRGITPTVENELQQRGKKKVTSTITERKVLMINLI